MRRALLSALTTVFLGAIVLWLLIFLWMLLGTTDAAPPSSLVLKLAFMAAGLLLMTLVGCIIQSVTWRCPACEHGLWGLRFSLRFCPHCGARLRDDAESGDRQGKSQP